MTPDATREHPDPLAAGQSPLVVDRQRIIHSAAFRRLQHKTQVFLAPQSDHFRTRLTHTLEVAHLARVLAAALQLNADLAEVVALAHDLGHPPFGHAGERALATCLRDHGGFEHNRHSLRIVEWLEHPYPEFRGLNLTHAVRECLAKHHTPYDRPGDHSLQDGRPPPPEGVVVDLADRLAFALHDVQDGLYAELLTVETLESLPLWRATYEGPTGTEAWRGHLRPAIDRLQQRFIEDIVQTSTGATDSPPRLSPELTAQLNELEGFLREHVYHSPWLQQADAQACQILSAVFDAYVTHPNELPPRFRLRIAEHGLHRVVTDFVAGMTDRFCLEEHARLADL